MKAQDKIIALVSDAAKLPVLEKFIKLAKEMQCEVDKEIDLLSACNEYHQNLITISIISNNLAATKLLIEAGVDINHGDMMGITPLLTAVFMNNIPAVDFLIANKADLDATDLNVGCHGFELDEAACAEQSEAFIRYVNNKKRKRHTSDRSCVSFESFYGDDVKEMSTSHNSPLKVSCFLSHHEIFYKLLSAGAAVTAPVIEAAVCVHQNDMLKALLERANEDELNTVNSEDLTVLDKALLFNNLTGLRMLFDHKARAVSSWYFVADKTYKSKANKNDNNWNCVVISSEVKILYLSRTIENYLNACLNKKEPAGEDMVNFHFNYNTEFFTFFVIYQLSPSVESYDKDAESTQFVRLRAVALMELFKRLLTLTINETIGHNDGAMPVSERKNRLLGIYLTIGGYLYRRTNPAAYLFFSRVEQDYAKKLKTEMLREEIIRLKGKEAGIVKSDMTCEMLQQQFPNEYMQAKENLMLKGHANLIPEENDPELPATEIEGDEAASIIPSLHSTVNAKTAEFLDEQADECKASRLLKRHNSPVFGDVEGIHSLQLPAKSARSKPQQATSIEADINLQPPSTPVLKG